MVITGLFASELKLHISYLDWFKLQWPYLGMFVLTQWWVQYYFRTRKVALPSGLQHIRQEQQRHENADARTWPILIVFGLVAMLWATEQWHKISSDNVALLGLAIMFTPGLLQFKWRDIQDRTIWGTVLLLAGALSISSAISSTGLAQWLATQIQEVAQGHPWWGILLIVMIGAHVIRIGMLSNVAAVTMLVPILLALAPKLGLHPVAFTMLVADTDSFAYLLPTQITAAVIAYSSGTFCTSDMPRSALSPC